LCSSFGGTGAGGGGSRLSLYSNKPIIAFKDPRDLKNGKDLDNIRLELQQVNVGM
jgi:hypothetical protein